MSILKSMLAGTAVVITAATAPFSAFSATETWKIDPVHSTVIFKIKHMNAAYNYGRFNDVSGSITRDDEKPENNSLQVNIKADSIDTANEKRDQHLKNADFLNTAQFPEITYKSRSMKKSGENQVQVEGDLTFHGVTKSVPLTLTLTGEGKDPRGGVRAGGETTFTLKRSDYGMNYMPQMLGDDIHVIVALEATKQE